MPVISIITCSYNPDERLLTRLLEAVQNLQIPDGYEMEYILVDNNSATPLHTVESYASFFRKHTAWARMISEKKPGATHGRVTAYLQSKGDIIVNFDDDNEPQADYLIQIVALRNQYPEVGVWGPGDVTVEFVGTPEAWTQKYALDKLQELHLKEVAISKDFLHFEEIPFGTGMILERRVMESYKDIYEEAERAQVVAEGRKGKSLLCSEDIQMVYMASRHDLAAGRAPQLKLKHLINEYKSNFDYIKRLYYGCSLGGFQVIAQSYPDQKMEAANPLTDTLHFALYNTYYLLKMGLLEGNFRKWQCQTAGMIATTESKYNYYQKSLPLYLRFLKSRLNIS